MAYPFLSGMAYKESEIAMDVFIVSRECGVVQDSSHPYIVLDHDDVVAWDVFTLELKIKELRELLKANSVNSVGRVMVTEFLAKLEAEIGALQNNR